MSAMKPSAKVAGCAPMPCTTRTPISVAIARLLASLTRAAIGRRPSSAVRRADWKRTAASSLRLEGWSLSPGDGASLEAAKPRGRAEAEEGHVHRHGIDLRG